MGRGALRPVVSLPTVCLHSVPSTALELPWGEGRLRLELISDEHGFDRPRISAALYDERLMLCRVVYDFPHLLRLLRSSRPDQPPARRSEHEPSVLSRVHAALHPYAADLVVWLESLGLDEQGD